MSMFRLTIRAMVGVLVLALVAETVVGEAASPTNQTAILKAQIKALQRDCKSKAKQIKELKQHITQLEEQIVELRRSSQPPAADQPDKPSPITSAKPGTIGELSEAECKGTKYYYYIPKSARYAKTKPLPVLVLVHGRGLNPVEYANRWLDIAERRRIVVIAPLFDKGTFPNYNRLNIMKPRADLRLLDILADAQLLWPLKTGEFFMYGHSAGGQFAHRFALVHPERIAKGVASCTGNYTFPDPNVTYHYGIGPREETKEMEFDVDGFVQRQFAIIVGQLDTDQEGAGGTDTQGKNRVERARNFYQAMKTYARQRQLPFNLRFTIIPKVGHSSKGTTPWARRYLFGMR